jgi:hypothetical protein
MYSTESFPAFLRNKWSSILKGKPIKKAYLSRCFFLQCNAAVGVKAFFDMMHIGPHKVMLFGAACTQVTDPIAKASKRWHLTQVRLKTVRTS